MVFVSCLGNELSQPLKKLIVRKFSGINGNPNAKETVWPQGKHFLEHVILHSLATEERGGRERQSYSFGGSGEILKGKMSPGESLR